LETSFKYSLEGQETDRLYFRRVVEADFNTWLEFCKYPDTLKYIFSKEQLQIVDPIERCKIWFKRVFDRYENGLGGMNALIDKRTNEFVGQCGLLIQTVDEVQELEIGYSLMPKHWGKGYAIEAAKKCKDFAFANNLSESLISVIHVDNAASAKVAINNAMYLEKTIASKGDPVNIFRIFKNNL
jgi:RimJ/RimL family protein N-acetyltransferase